MDEARRRERGEDGWVTAFADPDAVRMSRRKLAALGWTDATLEAERLRLFGARPEGQPPLDPEAADTQTQLVNRAATYERVRRARSQT